MTVKIPDFQRYQLAFTAHLRDPKQNAAPAGVVAERMAVYEEIVFNNLLQSVSACFPVASAVLGKRKWRSLVQKFMRCHSAHSPLFRDIPKQFLDYLQSNHDVRQTLPPYIFPLCHYEWIELYVSALDADVSAINAKQGELDLITNQAIFTPTLQLLSYDYAVHQISARKKPAQPIPTQLLVFRNAEHAVKFVEINAVTYQLITLMQSQKMTGADALLRVAQQLEQPLETVMQFGVSILHALKTQEIIIGVQASSTET